MDILAKSIIGVDVLTYDRTIITDVAGMVGKKPDKVTFDVHISSF